MTLETEHATAEDLLGRLLQGASTADPYSLLDQVRRERVVLVSEQLGGWFILSHELCNEVLRSASFHVALGEHLAMRDPRFERSAFLRNVANILAFMNGDKHSRCRRLVNRAFTPRTIEAFRHNIERVVDGVLDRLADQDRFDLHEQISRQVPGSVICQMMNIPVDDRGPLLKWSDEIAHAVRPIIPDEALADADAAVEAYWEYIVGLAEDRRKHLGDDIISELLRAEDDEGRMSPEEFVGVTHSLITGGIETAQGMLSAGVLGLLSTPAEADKLRADPDLSAGAVEEALRLEAPLQLAFQRIALEDTTVGGEQIREGEVVNVMIGAANHDPIAFPPDPHAFRIDRRRERPHLAFGSGVHYCVGAALARVEGEVTFRKLLTRFPDLALAESEVYWRPGYVLRSQDRLEVVRTG